jgi:hypothetical protein
MKKSLIILFTALVIFTGCFIPIPPKTDDPFPPSPATALTENVWTSGYLGTADRDQWFKFTASANLHFVHISLGTSGNRLTVYLYDSEGEKIGNWVDISDSSSSAKYVSYSSFTAGAEYYVKVERYSGEACTYKIGLNTSEKPPVMIKLPSAKELTVDTPENGNIPEWTGEEWFKFKATAETQYIHIISGELTNVGIQLYKVKDDIFGDPFGDLIRIYNTGNKYTKQTLTIGAEYCIKITPSSYNDKGTYQIGFNTLFIPPPPSNIKQLTGNTWANNNSFTANKKEEHWFSFTATNATQYIHVDFGTAGTDATSFAFQGLDIVLYDGNGDMVGSSVRLYDSNKSMSRSSLTVNNKYYINVTPHSSVYSGTYKIGFTTNATAPTS